MEPQELAPLGTMARRLKVPARWLKAESDAGRIPHLRAGNQRLFNVEVVTRLLAERAGKAPVRDAPEDRRGQNGAA